MGYINIKDASAYLSIKSKTLYAWASQGKMPYYRINGLLRFKKEELDKWLEGCKHKPEELEIAAKRIIANGINKVYNATSGKPSREPGSHQKGGY